MTSGLTHFHRKDGYYGEVRVQMGFLHRKADFRGEVRFRCGFSTGRAIFVEKCGHTKTDTSKEMSDLSIHIGKSFSS